MAEYLALDLVTDAKNILVIISAMSGIANTPRSLKVLEEKMNNKLYYCKKKVFKAFYGLEVIELLEKEEEDKCA